MKEKEPSPGRNRPNEERSNNDPYTREESAQQPGVNTYSSSDSDEKNEHLTRTASDNFREEDWKENADPSFDEPPAK